LHSHWLLTPYDAEVLSRLQRVEPDEQAQDEREEGASDHHPSLDGEPLSVRGEGESGERDDEGYENEQRVDQASGQRALVQQEGKGNIGRRQVGQQLLLSKEGEGDEESSTSQKEEVDEQVEDHEVIHGCRSRDVESVGGSKSLLTNSRDDRRPGVYDG